MAKEKFVFHNSYVDYSGIDQGIRTSRNLTLDEVVKQCYGTISKKTLISYEQGHTDAKASNLMMLSYVLDTSIDALVKRKNKYLFGESHMITRYKLDSLGRYEKCPQSENFVFDNNLNESKKLVAVDLLSDSLLLKMPRGTTLIIDMNLHVINQINEQGVYALLRDKEFYYPSIVRLTPTSRRKNTYTYLDQNMIPIQTGKDDIDTILIGIIKKAIKDF
jgi:transcriptional regulator with XRE-family HTH domain